MDRTRTVIIRRPAEDEHEKTGLGRYADNCQECLGTLPTVEADLNLKSGLMNFVINGIIRPFFRMKDLDGNDTVFHATDELCGFAFRFLRGKKILTVHHIIERSECSSAYYAIWMRNLRSAIAHADRIIAISDLTLDELRKLGVPDEKTVRIDNRISPAFRRLEIAKKDIICCIGELIPRKNMSASIEAFAELVSHPETSNYRLVICGKGTEEQSLKELARVLNVSDCVEFVRDMDTEMIVELYNESRFVFNTSLHEGL